METEIFLLSFVTALGFIIGSFLNVVALRYNTGRSLEGRSACFSCTSVLAWYELVPVGSYLLQFGRCRRCDARISPQYPLVELLTGVLFLLLHLKLFSGGVSLGYALSFALYAAITSLLVAILVYDIRHKIIPTGLVYASALLALVASFIDFAAFSFQIPSFLQVVAGPVVALPFAFLWFVSRGRWMGLGDAKLALVMGWLVGLSQGFTAVLLAFWSGALISVAFLALGRLQRRSSGRFSSTPTGTSLLLQRLPLLTMKSEVPFAPFLIVSLWTVFFTGFNLFSYLAPLN